MPETGIYTTDDRGRLCFLPSVPAAPRLEDVFEAASAAETAIRKFDDAVAAFPIPVLGSLFARLDAVYSSATEGHTTTFSDLLEYESEIKRAADPDDAEAVSACAVAFDETASESQFAVKIAWQADDLIELTKRIHYRLFVTSRDLRDREAGPGRLKSVANATSDRDAPAGQFHYTAPELTEEALRRWGAFVLERGAMPEIVRQALGHWMFEHIHPVHDGNGRIGRLLIPLLLKGKGATRMPSAFCGEAVFQNRDTYIDALKETRRSGDFAFWTRMMLSLMKQTADANLERLERLRIVHDEWARLTARYRRHGVIHDLAPWIIAHPKFTVADAIRGIGRGTHPAVSRAVRELINLNLIAPAGAKGHERLFEATRVIRLFDKIRLVPD